MKGSLAAFDMINGRKAAALLVDGKLEDFLIDPPDAWIVPGSIYRGKVGRQLKGQGGAILETTDGPLFLRHVKGLNQGQMVFAQATTFAEPGKATPASPKLTFKSRFVVVTPGAAGANIARSIKDEERRVALREILAEIALPDDVGLVVRSTAGQAADDAILADIQSTLQLSVNVTSEPMTGPVEKLVDGPDAEELAWREWPVPDTSLNEAGAFASCGVDDAIEALRHPKVALSGGGHMFVEPTRALTAVDVNTGADTSPAAALKANLAAASELPRALRLRGLGGQIVIDFAPLPKRDRRQIETAMTRACRTDSIETSVVGWTPLGHLELQRKRERLPLSEALK